MMKDICNTTTSKEINKEKQLSHCFTSMTSLPRSILNWIDKNMNDIVVVLNEIGNIVYITKSVKNILNYRPNSLLGVNWTEIILNEEVNKIKQYITNNINVDAKKFTFLLKIPDRQGRNIQFQCMLTKIKENGEYIYISTLKDITNKQEMDEMMVRSEKMSVAGQLAAGIAHEIRNPLTSLKGFLQLLQAGTKQKDAYYKIMKDEIDKIETITSELLFISRPFTDRKEYESLNAMINDVLILLEPQARLKDVRLMYNGGKEDFDLYCDRSQIKQVLINLVKNAIEASEQSSVVKVQAYQVSDDILIEVIDEGVGISPSIIHKLDEPFFTTKQSGTGLGLMITKNILEHHYANLKIIPNEGKGTTFRIHFPIDP